MKSNSKRRTILPDIHYNVRIDNAKHELNNVGIRFLVRQEVGFLNYFEKVCVKVYENGIGNR